MERLCILTSPRQVVYVSEDCGAGRISGPKMHRLGSRGNEVITSAQ